MVIEIVFTGSQWAGLENHLFSAAKPWSASDCDEQMALLLAGRPRLPEAPVSLSGSYCSRGGVIWLSNRLSA